MGERIKEGRKLTKSTTFIRDMLGYHPIIFSKNFHNTYISIEPRNIYLVFKFEEDIVKSVKDLMIEKELRMHSCFIEKIDKDSYEIFKYEVPKVQTINFLCFLDGKYTHFDDEYKSYLLNLYVDYNNDKFQNIKRILYPTRKDINALEEVLGLFSPKEKLPDTAEVFDKPDLEEEIFNLDKLE